MLDPSKFFKNHRFKFFNYSRIKNLLVSISKTIQNPRIADFNYFKNFLRLVVFMGKEKKPPMFFNLSFFFSGL